MAANLEKYKGINRDYFILRDKETGEIVKIGRYWDDGIAERLQFGEWRRNRILDSEMFDGLLE